MVFGNGTFRSRAASLLRPSSASDAAKEKGASEAPLNEKRSQDTAQTELDQTQTTSSGQKIYHSSGQNAVLHDRDAQRVVRTIPSELFSGVYYVLHIGPWRKDTWYLFPVCTTSADGCAEL